MPTAVQYIAQVFHLHFVQFPGLPIDDQFSKPDNVVQRRTQFVAHIGQKLAFGFVGLFGLKTFFRESFSGF